MKHTRSRKPVTLATAMDRIDLTQLALAQKSGIDRTWIGRLQQGRAAKVGKDTYDTLDAALRDLGALKPSEVLAIGS